MIRALSTRIHGFFWPASGLLPMGVKGRWYLMNHSRIVYETSVIDSVGDTKVPRVVPKSFTEADSVPDANKIVARLEQEFLQLETKVMYTEYLFAKAYNDTKEQHNKAEDIIKSKEKQKHKAKVKEEFRPMTNDEKATIYTIHNLAKDQTIAVSINELAILIKCIAKVPKLTAKTAEVLRETIPFLPSPYKELCMYLVLKTDVLEGAEEYPEAELRTLNGKDNYLVQLLALALQRENLFFANAFLKQAISAKNEKLLAILLESLVKELPTVSDKTVCQVMALRTYNAMLSLHKEEKSQEPVDLGEHVDINQIFRELREKYKFRQIMDPVTDEDILLSCVEMHSELVYPVKDKLNAKSVIHYTELVRYMLQWVNNDKFISGMLQLIKNMGKHSQESMEEMILRLKEAKMATGRLPGLLCRTMITKTTDKLSSKDLSQNEQVFLAYLLYEVGEYEKVKQFLSSSEATQKLPLASYLLAASNLDQMQEDSMSPPDLLLNVRKLCAERNEAEACNRLKDAIAETWKKKSTESEELKKAYQRIFTNQPNASGIIVPSMAPPQKKSILSTVTSHNPYEQLFGLAYKPSKAAEVKKESKLLAEFFKESRNIMTKGIMTTLNEEEVAANMLNYTRLIRSSRRIDMPALKFNLYRVCNSIARNKFRYSVELMKRYKDKSLPKEKIEITDKEDRVKRLKEQDDKRRAEYTLLFTNTKRYIKDFEKQRYRDILKPYKKVYTCIRNPFGNIGKEPPKDDQYHRDKEADKPADDLKIGPMGKLVKGNVEASSIDSRKRSLAVIEKHLRITRREDRQVPKEVVKKIKRHLVTQAVQKYAWQKMLQCVRRRNINSYLASMEAALLLKGDKIQENVDYNMEKMKETARDMLLPIEHHLFHEKMFEAKDTLGLPLNRRVHMCQNCISKSKKELEQYSQQIMELLEKKEEKPKQELNAVYSKMLGTQDNIKECEKLLQAEVYVKETESVATADTKALINKIFETKEGLEVPLVLLLDLKEYCQKRGLLEIVKVINKLISGHNSS